MKIYDTLSRKIKSLNIQKDRQTKLFVCGPTVYDFSHLGHAKTYTQFDFIVKYLRHLGLDVYYLQNITDIDDKIIARANDRGENWQNIARRYEEIYQQDMRNLHNTAVTEYARATDHINEIVSQIQRLLDIGFAYRTSDSIYYEISKFPAYGQLSKRTETEKDDAVSRIDESNEKRGWNDFCLWKNSKPDEPSWDTDLGPGRPGWHIEDTAITEKYFGSQYDMHGGAIDLIFPHHEAEIAQMEALSGQRPLVNFWLHTGFLNINAAKMSKSLGNFKTIRDALKEYDYRVLRYLFISSHYRAAIDFSDSLLDQARQSLERIDEFTFRVDENYDDKENKPSLKKLKENIDESLKNDFNTSQALAYLFDFIKSRQSKKTGKNTWELFKSINTYLDFITLDFEIHDKKIQTLIKEREKHRKDKDFARADAIRDQLIKMGVKIYDTDQGTKYRT